MPILEANPQANNWPTVSVIMPIRNEARYIKRSLEAVLAQDYQCAQLEIIVADGMSSDRTREIVQDTGAGETA